MKPTTVGSLRRCGTKGKARFRVDGLHSNIRRVNDRQQPKYHAEQFLDRFLPFVLCEKLKYA